MAAKELNMGLFDKPTVLNVTHKRTVGAAIADGLLRTSETTAEDVEATRIRTESEAAEKREGLAAVQAVNFDGDAKTIVAALSNLQTMAVGNSADKESAKAVRKAAFVKMELGIRMLRSAGDTVNAEYFEKQLKGMKFKTFIPLIAGLVGGVVLILICLIYFAAGGAKSKANIKTETTRLEALVVEISTAIENQDWVTAKLKTTELVYNDISGFPQNNLAREWKQKQRLFLQQIEDGENAE
jgi:hypothetical protein